MSTAEFIQNTAILIAFLGVIYLVARLFSRVKDGISARKLAPLAPLVQGSVDPTRGVLNGTYKGRRVVVTYTPHHTVGTDESASQFNASHVCILDLPGKKDWWLSFHVSGLLGQGPKRLWVDSHNPDLSERLRTSGIIEEVEAANARTCTYVAVRFDSFSKHLTYTDDVSPRTVPTAESLQRQLDMAVRAAAVNEALNE